MCTSSIYLYDGGAPILLIVLNIVQSLLFLLAIWALLYLIIRLIQKRIKKQPLFDDAIRRAVAILTIVATYSCLYISLDLMPISFGYHVSFWLVAITVWLITLTQKTTRFFTRF